MLHLAKRIILKNCIATFDFNISPVSIAKQHQQAAKVLFTTRDVARMLIGMCVYIHILPD
jgi:hypothetical protein